MKPIFIIEHLEPKVWPWCLIEYESISKITGKKNVLFSNVKEKKILSRYGNVTSESVRTMQLERACVLDPAGTKELTPKEAKKYDYFIIGGILGDEHFNWRTKKELTRFMKHVPVYHLGKGQFSTDNAVYVTKRISEGTALKAIPFQDTIEIPITSIESVILPYRYPLVNGKPRISKKLIRYLKHKKDF